MSQADLDGTYWRGFTDASPHGVLVIDLEGTVLFVSRIVRVYADRRIVARKVFPPRREHALPSPH